MSRSSLTRSRDGTPIAFDLIGSGPALILIEPAGHYRGLSAFDDLVPLLSQDFTLCRYDRRGRGDSGDTPPYAPGARSRILRRWSRFWAARSALTAILRARFWRFMRRRRAFRWRALS